MNPLQTLNLKQRCAVKTVSGPVIITAGPGTGKTKTLVARIIYLIQEKKVAPKNILAITFTQRAAGEIKERIQHEIASNSFPFIGTFHSLAHHILSSEDEKIQIIPEEERALLLREIVKNKTASPELKSLPFKEISLLVSKQKNSLEGTAGFPKGVFELTNIYNGILRERKLHDFDDLLTGAYENLKNNPDATHTFREKFQHVLVDEFQDTSQLQYEIVKMLLDENKNIFVIGDPLQAIYSFRGASDKAFLDFEKDFPEAKTLNLSTNYRSHQHIIDISHNLFPQSPKLQPFSKEPGKIFHITTLNDHSEAEWVIKNIEKTMGGVELLASGGENEDNNQVRFSDFAVIYRTHHAARVIKQKFRESLIPFQTIGADSLYEQKEIKFIIACLRHLHCQNGKTKKELEDISLEKNFCLLHQKLDSIPRDVPLFSLVDSLVSAFQIMELIKDKPQKISFLQEFNCLLPAYGDQKSGLEMFVSHLEKLKDNEYYDMDADKVTLLSMHASKGLEFPHVFICGFEEGLIPHEKKQKIENLEEEKRLLYVAMTRAKKSVCLISAKKRNKKTCTPSRFLSDLRSPLLQEKEDEVIAKIEKKQKQKKEKERQLRLFT